MNLQTVDAIKINKENLNDINDKLSSMKLSAEWDSITEDTSFSIPVKIEGIRLINTKSKEKLFVKEGSKLIFSTNGIIFIIYDNKDKAVQYEI